MSVSVIVQGQLLVYPLQRYFREYPICFCKFIEHTLDHHTQQSLFISGEFSSNDVAQGLIGRTAVRPHADRFTY